MILFDLIQLALIPSLINSGYFEDNNNTTSITTQNKTSEGNSTTFNVLILSDNFIEVSKNVNTSESSVNSSTDSNKVESYDAIVITSRLLSSNSEPKSGNQPLIQKQDENENELILSRRNFPQNHAQKPKDLGYGLINLARWPWPAYPQPPKFLNTTTINTPTLKPGNVIIFEENEDLKCAGNQTVYNDKCFDVLKQLPCQSGQWLVEDENTKKGKCLENKCAKNPNTAFFQDNKDVRIPDNCIQIRSEEPCGSESGMRTYIFKSGEVQCDCKEGFLYNKKDGKCYEAYKRGPCKEYEYFSTLPANKGESLADSREALCVFNQCLIEGYFCTATKCISNKRKTRMNGIASKTEPNLWLPKSCAKFGSSCTKEGTGVFIVDPNTNTPSCLNDIKELHPPNRIIGNVPTLKCAPGSRRDVLGTCRPATVIDFGDR